MNPRLKSSKKWTNFPKEYSDQIQTVFKENFANYFDEADGELIVEGRIYPEEIMLRIGFNQKQRLTQPNFETSINYSSESEDAISCIHICVDVAASMMMEYFEQDGDVDFPYVWKEYPFKGKTVFLKYSSENSILEAEANKLLGLDETGILHEEVESEDALAHAENSEELSPPRDEDDLEDSEIDDDNLEEEYDDLDDDGDQSPQMFGGSGKKKLH